MTLLDALIEQLHAAATGGNRGVAALPAALLWTDRERQWESLVPALRERMPALLAFGAYDPGLRRGPAVWLKCAIAGVLDGVDLRGQVPVVYLPGVGRADLRAIEDCPRELQPLAELQYRGAYWSQANAKDWTVGAFLASKNGGLGLDVAGDRATQAALQRALEGGVLLDRSVEELRSRTLDAAWFDVLLAPNPVRDLLAWLDDPPGVEGRWSAGRRQVFAERCRSDYGFDPQRDGVLAAAEKLAGRAGAWAAVWELYRDAYAGFPKVAERLATLAPPAPRTLFDDPGGHAGYPRANEEAEDELRYRLGALGALAPASARAALSELETTHGGRRAWVWSRMGRAPLAQALGHLAELATLSAQVPGGPTVERMAGAYCDAGWRVDAAALDALAAVQGRADVEAVSAALGATYVPWLEEAARRFQELVKAQGGLNEGTPAPSAADVAGTCTVFVDGLRYDVAQRLAARLGELGRVSLGAAWTSIPSVTASGKPWASPVARAVGGSTEDEDFLPSVAADGRPLTAHHFRKLLEAEGVQVPGRDETGDPAGRAWVECGDLDHYGHEHGLRLARDIDAQLERIFERIAELRDAGWTRFRIVTDHGWLLVPGGLPKAGLARHQAQTRWGRCAVLKDTAHATALTFGWDWCRQVQIAMAPGISSFVAGAEYAHGGLTLQECLVPVLELQAHAVAKPALRVDIVRVGWKGLRCTVEVAPVVPGLTADLRTKAAQAASSVVASPKAVEGGRASLAVADDAHEGAAAFVVVLDEAGAVLQKAPTTVGG